MLEKKRESKTKSLLGGVVQEIERIVNRKEASKRIEQMCKTEGITLPLDYRVRNIRGNVLQVSVTPTKELRARYGAEFESLQQNGKQILKKTSKLRKKIIEAVVKN